MNILDWVGWKFSQFRRWLRYTLLYRGKWKKMFNSESDMAHWEIIHDSDNKNVMLMYVPNDDYSEDDIKIIVPYEEFEDLVKFMINIR